MAMIALGLSLPASPGVVVERAIAAPLPLYSLVAPPTASFAWFPSFPGVDEKFTLVSTSSDVLSPIVAFAWDTSGNGSFGEFQAGGASASAVFATPGDHIVRLRVTAADHLSSTASETIQMRAPAAGVLRPFPTVLIFGRPFAAGVRVRELAVKAPAKAAIKISCRGRGCPVHAAAGLGVSRGGHTVPVPFRRFQRFLPAGVTLEIRVSKGASIGAYTRFEVRRHRLPLRVDSCLDPSRRRPIACPSG